MFRRQPVVALLVIVLVAACGASAASPSPAVSGNANGQPPVADGVAALVAHSRADVFADAHSGDTEPDGRATDALADAHHDGRSRLLPDARWQRRRGRQRADSRSGPPDGAEEHGDGKAAMKALLAGPSAKERAPKWPIKTLIPAGTKLLGIEISGGLATVDLSAEFASLSPDDVWGGGSYSLHGRVAQVVYTLTQFTTVDRVTFKLDGKPVKVLFGMPDPESGASEAIAMDKPVTRATDRDHYSYRDHFLPLIFVDRPSGCRPAEPRPGHRARQRLRGAVPDHPARSQ